jgi:cell wall assembly regulator SMI1
VISGYELRGYRIAVTAAAEPLPGPKRTPFADTSPAQVRAALTPEDSAEFDRQWVAVMARATQELDLTEVLETLETWRRVAWVTATTGTERYRAVLASAEHRLRTGERHPSAVLWSQLKAELGLPE